MFSAAASLGVSLLWDTDVGLSQIDKYAYADEDFIKVQSYTLFSPWYLTHASVRQAGAMLANGLIHSGVRTEMDAALALLSEHVESKSVPLRVAAIIGCALLHSLSTSNGH